jgi:hypothetical protein
MFLLTVHTLYRVIRSHNSKYLLTVAVQYNLIGLISHSIATYNSPHSSYHIVTCSHQSFGWLSAVQQLKCKEVFFTSAKSVHCQTLPGISFLLKLPKWVLEYISLWSCAKHIGSILSGYSFLAIAGTFHQIESDMRKRVNTCITEHGGQ